MNPRHERAKLRRAIQLTQWAVQLFHRADAADKAGMPTLALLLARAAHDCRVASNELLYR